MQHINAQTNAVSHKFLCGQQHSDLHVSVIFVNATLTNFIDRKALTTLFLVTTTSK